MKHLINTYSPALLMNFENNVCRFTANLMGDKNQGIGSFRWSDCEAPLLTCENDKETWIVELPNYFSGECSQRVCLAIASLSVLNHMAWFYHDVAKDGDENSNRKLADKMSNAYHTVRYYVMDSGDYTKEEVNLIMRAID